MSRTYSKHKNENQKHPKVHFHQYLYNAKEPHGYITYDEPEEFLEDSESMRQSFRHQARRMRYQ